MSRTREALLWLGLVGAALAWTGQLVLGYAVEEIACSRGTRGSDLWGLGVTPVVAILSGVALALALASVGAAMFRWRSGPRHDPNGRIGFMAFGGFLASTLFLFLIAMTTVGILILEPCTSG